MPTDKTETITPQPVAASAPAPSSQPREVRDSDKDIGEWKLSPWSGLARWVNSATNEESFDEKKVRKLAKQK